MKRLLTVLLLALFVLSTSVSALTVSEPGVFPIVEEETTLTIMAHA